MIYSSVYSNLSCVLIHESYPLFSNDTMITFDFEKDEIGKNCELPIWISNDGEEMKRG